MKSTMQIRYKGGCGASEWVRKVREGRVQIMQVNFSNMRFVKVKYSSAYGTNAIN